MKMLSRAGGASIKGLYRLRFEPAMESAYQDAAVDHKKTPRILLFLFLGLCFVLAPLYQTYFFGVASSADEWLRILEIYAVGPLSFAAALATAFGRRRLLTSLIQSVAVVVLWVSPLFLRYLALHGAMLYPGSMVGIVVIAIAIFGGFNWYVFSLGSVIVLIVAAVQEVQLGASSTEAWLDVNALVLTGLIAALGAYAIEVSHRLAWANGHTANLLARIDMLTGLSTRADFDRSLPGLLMQARRDQIGIAVGVLEIDSSERIGPEQDQAVGDAGLAALGLILRNRLVRRPFDMAVRFSDSEMLVLWYGVPQAAAKQLEESLADGVQAVSTTTADGRKVTVAARCSVSWLVPDKTSSTLELVGDIEQRLALARIEGWDRAQAGR